MLRSFALGGICATLCCAQGIVTTSAGTDFFFPSQPVPAADAPLISPQRAAVDSRGNVYVTLPAINAVVRIAPDGTASAFAGNGLATFAGDGGDARAASLNRPQAVAVDRDGGILIGDCENGRLRKVSPSGIITTIAGGGNNPGDDVPALEASGSCHSPLAVDPQNGNIYFGGRGGVRVYRLTPAGRVQLVAGNGENGTGGDNGLAVRAQLGFVNALAVDSQGNLYIAHEGNGGNDGRVRRVASDGTIALFAGGGTVSPPETAASAREANLRLPNGLVFEPDGSLLFSDRGFQALFRISPQGRVTRVAGDGNPRLAGDNGAALAASLSTPLGIDRDSSGNIYVADQDNHRIRVISGGTIRTFAGRSDFTGDGLNAQFARFSTAQFIAVDRNDRLIVSDRLANRIRRVNPDGLIETIAGDGRLLGPQVNLATQSPVGTPNGVAVDPNNNVVFVRFSQIHRLATNGTFSLVAGVGGFGFSGDNGPALQAQLNFPRSVHVDRAGNIYFADGFNNRVRRIDTRGIITTFAGNGDTGFSGDDGPAVQARLSDVGAIASDAAGNIYLADTSNHRVRRVDTRGIITTFAGSGQPAFSGDGGPAALASFSFPRGLVFDSPGNLYVLASGRIRRIAPDGTITTVAGSGRSGYSGDGGPSLSASFNDAFSLAIDSRGSIYIADRGNGRVRLFQPGRGASIILSQKGLNFSATPAAAPPPQTFQVVNGGDVPLAFGISTSTTSGGTWLTVATPGGTAPAGQASPAIEVNVNPAQLAPGVYYGQVEVRAPLAVNSPQLITVVLNVQAAGASAPVDVTPAGVIVTGVAGGAAPAIQRITLSTASTRAVTFNATTAFLDGRTFFTAAPTTGSVVAGRPVTVELRPSIASIPAGVFNGAVTFALSDQSTRLVPVVLVLSGTGSTAAKGKSADGCTPRRLIPVFTVLGGGFTATAGYPSPVEVRVVDDCGDAFTNGAVTATFSNGDPALPLTSLRDGRWSATWQSGSRTGDVAVTAQARTNAGDVTGSAEVRGGLGANPDPAPSVAAGGVLSAASFALGAPLAPGSIVSIFGDKLARDTGSAPALPLPVVLDQTRVSVAGRSLPLIFVSVNQINAVIPLDLAVNARHQLVVRRGNALSIPEPVDAVPGQAAVFTRNLRGSGDAIVVAANSDGSASIVSPESPVTEGTVIVIYCSGLGEVEPRAIAGSPTPLSPLSPVVEPVTVTIGGIPASVFFAGLTPGFTGLYQINAVIPAGIAPGDAVPLVISQAGASSPATTLAVR